MSSGVVRSTALRAGGACVRCRKGKTKCVYENGRAPCKNCAKGMHECYLPSESMAHHHGQSPARHTGSHHRPARESLPASGPGANDGNSRQVAVGSASTSANSRNVQNAAADKLTPELIAECERVISKTFPACVAFHKPSFVQHLKNASLEPSLVYGLLSVAARSSHTLIRRYGSPTSAAEYFASKSMSLVSQNLDHPNLADIQALCLVVIHEWGTRNAVRAYIFLGQAARMLQMYRILNGHRNDSDRFQRDESFRRTLWLIHVLDCLLTSTPGRYSSLSPQDSLDVPLPCSDINFAFGNAVQVKTLLQHLDPIRYPMPATEFPVGEVGEFGYIVLASSIWRDTVAMLTGTTLANFREEHWTELVDKIEGLRSSLPMQFVDKPGQIGLHMTMGSGFTFAMLHCLLHCANIFVHRRRLLQEVTDSAFNLDSFRLSPRCHDVIDRLFTSCHSISSLLNAVEAGSDKDHPTCFPIFMLFSSFTASATVAYLSLKGLTPPTAVETAAHIVEEGLRFMSEGTENWPLMSSWMRHLTVMQRVLNNDAASQSRHISSSGPVKDEVSSNADTAEPMEYDHHPPNMTAQQHGPQPPRSISDSGRGDSEPPVTTIPRRPGVTTINGNSGGVSTPQSNVSPPPAPQPGQPQQQGPTPPQAQQPYPPYPEAKQQTPEVVTNGSVPPAPEAVTTSQDMTAPELCQVFERQLLEMDDLAAFMGGGV